MLFFVFAATKSAFGLITVNDKINITVDNVYPLMKLFEIDGKDEVIMDMVREACIESKAL